MRANAFPRGVRAVVHRALQSLRAAPVAVQLHRDAGADEVKWGPQEDDDWADIEWS